MKLEDISVGLKVKLSDSFILYGRDNPELMRNLISMRGTIARIGTPYSSILISVNWGSHNSWQGPGDLEKDLV